jgi:hypothetical protein
MYSVKVGSSALLLSDHTLIALRTVGGLAIRHREAS